MHHTHNSITMILFSDCCGAAPWLNNEDLGRCSKCKECCEFDSDEEPVSDKQKLKQLASLLWVTCRVDELGLAGARREMFKRGLSDKEIKFVNLQLLNFLNQ